MSDFDKTDEEILQRIRERSKQENTVESFLYGLLSTAEPHVVENFENQAVAMHKLGIQIGMQMKEAESDPHKKAEWMSMLDRVQTGLSTGFGAQPKDDDTDI